MKIIKIEQNMCPQCDSLEYMLQEIPEVSEKVERVNIRVKGNEHYKNKYGIMSTPVLLFLDEDGNEIDRITGIAGLNPDKIVEKVKELE